MGILKNDLLELLEDLREQIKNEEMTKTGRVPVVCSDEALVAIANNKPLKISDFQAISGIGRTFIDKYSTRFLQVILKYQTKDVKEVKVSRNANKILDHYKDRLTNISKRNPNLYTGRIVKRFSIDCSTFSIPLEFKDFLSNPKRQLIHIQKDQILEDLTQIYREVVKDEKETGSYDLYIAYPYIEGYFKSDQFIIRAPLLYFPITLERGNRHFTIRKDKEKDILFNRDLILTSTKMEKGDLLKDVPQIDHIDHTVFKEVIIPYYEKQGLKILDVDLRYEFEPFTSIQKDKFSKRKKDLFSIKEYVTLGHYKLYSSMLQKDMTNIINSNKYNSLLEGLIDETNLFDKEKENPFEVDYKQVKESELSYINDVNYSQEKVITLLNKEQKLVIWGPPGTGKSQTITSLIASSVLKGENVLVVSEKKAALDVIYSRLKNASRYVLYIDDSENKASFYQKINDLLHPALPQRTINNDTYQIEEKINDLLKTMDESLKLLYQEKIQDVPVYELFSRFVKDKDMKSNLSPKMVHRMFNEYFKTIEFKELKKIEDKFQKNTFLEDMLLFHEFYSSEPFFQKMETKITRSNQLEFAQFCEDVNKSRKVYQTRWHFKKKRIVKDLLTQHPLNYLFAKAKYGEKYIQYALQDSNLHRFIQAHLNKLDKYKTQYTALNSSEKNYLQMLTTSPLLNDIPAKSSIHHYLFDAFYTGFLEEYEAKYQKYLYIIDEYHKKQEDLSVLIQEKQSVTEESFEMELYKHALNLNNTKRIMDIRRALDSERKMSVKSFIDIFQVELLGNIRIWMMTPESVSSSIPLIYGMFDLVIFDEASQMFVEKGIPAIYRAKKVVIAGDTKQLRPSSLGVGRVEYETDEEVDPLEDLSMDAKSLLDLARYRYHETILNYHYRSQYEELISFSNYAFYHGKLIVSPNQTQSKKPPIEYIYVPNGVFENRKNKEEGQSVVSILKKVLKTKDSKETIGIITFNSSQRDYIENLIDEELFKKSVYQKKLERELNRIEDGEDKSLFVKNIENVQGDERDIIIFSMGYSRNEFGSFKRNFGWLNNEGGENRLNVAISRAKKKIYFVTSFMPEEFHIEDLKNKGPLLLKQYMRYCYAVSNSDSEKAKQILDSLSPTTKVVQESKNLLVDEIEKRLQKSGYEVHKNIGIGGYSIDLAIYDSSNQTYLIGILCDVHLNDFLNARKDLYHQEKFLKSRGWIVYRVFSSNWYADPNREIRAIKDQIKMNQ